MREIIAACALLAFAAQASAAPLVIKNENVRKECGACHMAFQPPFLPKRSWEALMKDLGNHFGEDATLTDAAVAQDITAYLVENAGDAGGRPNNWVRRIPADQTPLRITETPGWVRAHSEEVSAAAWKKAGSKANCTACHRAAGMGVYEHEEGEEGEGGEGGGDND